MTASPLSALILVSTTLLFASARFDVLLQVVGWILFCSHAAGTFAAYNFLHPILDPVQEVSGVIIDILPQSPLLLLLVSTVVNVAAIGLLSDDSSPSRGSWIAFSLVRMLLPVSTSSSFTAQDDIVPVHAICYGLLVALSLVSPLASWPTRCFVLAEAVYSVSTDFSRPASESAAVALILCLLHDVVATYFLYFMESTLFMVAGVFTLETLVVVLTGAGEETPLMHTWTTTLDPWSAPSLVDYLTTRAPPVLLLAWALGIHVRTLTQGRLSPTGLARASLLGLLGGLALLAVTTPKAANKPSFAAVVAILAMAASKFLARASARKIPPNEWISATGVFRLSHLDNDLGDFLYEVDQDEEEEQQKLAMPAGGGELLPSQEQVAPLDRAAVEARLDELQTQLHKCKQGAFRQAAIASGMLDAKAKDQAKLELEMWQERERRVLDEMARLQQML